MSKENKKPQQTDRSKCWNCSKKVGVIVMIVDIKPIYYYYGAARKWPFHGGRYIILEIFRYGDIEEYSSV